MGGRMKKVYKMGDKINITIGEKTIETWIDKYGTQRLPNNPLFSALFECEALDLNRLAIAYRRSQINFEHYLEYYLNIGYSVCGFAELSSFEHLEIKNPLWEEE